VNSLSDFQCLGCLFAGMDMDDLQLLQRYVREGCEEAFAELVRRYADLVWSAGWRVTRNASLAEDVVQMVFADLARKARWLPDKTIIPGWLYRAACLAASKAVRAESRRLSRERAAMELQANSADDPQQVETHRLMPLLDEAVGALSEADRNAILLRFFAKKNLAEIGAAMGISDDAAQKRLSRAIEKLRRIFEGKGITASAGAVAAVLGSAGTQAAPVGLAAAVALSSVSLAGSAATGTGVLAMLASVPSQFAVMKTNLAIAAVALATVATPLLIQHRALTDLEAENRTLATETASLEELRQRHAELLKSAHAADELERLRAGQEEMERLRNELEQHQQKGIEQKLVVQQQWLAARAALDQAREEARFEQARFEFEAAQAETVNHAKQLGLSARLWATDNDDQLPPSILSMTNELAGLLPIALEQFEFVQHARPISESEPLLLLFREKEPRKSPAGSWYRSYVRVDGSVLTPHYLDPAEFETWEKQFVASEP
jgi:RNA polymerase sigma factor (sigma-70 family)